MKLTQHFPNERQGKTFADVIARAPAALDEMLSFLDEPKRREHLEWAQTNMEKPALSGVVLQLERLPEVARVLRGDPGLAARFRQATGAAVRMVMEHRGWRKTGVKKTVGVGEFFDRAEWYERP